MNFSARGDKVARISRHFGLAERQRSGVHTCPGGDRDSTHSADVDYTNLLPALSRLNVGRFYIQLASEPDRRRILSAVRKVLKPRIGTQMASDVIGV